MPRPTPYQLERALAASDEDVAYWGTRNPERDQNDFAITALANEVRALREEAASENSEARRIFTREFKAELLERTQECDRLREDVARTPVIAQAAATLQRNVDTIAHNMVIAQRDEALDTIARIEALVSSDHPLYLDKDDVRAALKGGA